MGRCMILMSHLTSWSSASSGLLIRAAAETARQSARFASSPDRRGPRGRSGRLSTRERKNQIINVPESFPHADLKLLESRRFFLRVGDHRRERRYGFPDFIAVFSASV